MKPRTWVEAPTIEVPPEVMASRTALAKEVVRRAKLWAEAVAASEKASDRMRDLPLGSSRACKTTVSARWTCAAEDRDWKERNLVAALEAANLTTLNDRGL